MEHTIVVCQVLGSNDLKDGEEHMVDALASQLWHYKENLSSSLGDCLSAMEKLSQETHQLIEDMSYSPCVQTVVSAIRSKRSSAQERGHCAYTSCATPWIYLRDHTEDMRTWDGKFTSTLEAWVCELQGKTMENGVLPGKWLLQFLLGRYPENVDGLSLLLA